MIDKTDWEFLHVGVIVRDIKAAYDFYTSLGFCTIDAPHQPVAPTAERPRTTWISRVVRGGGMLELVQPEGQYVNREFLDTVGEGINHIAFSVADLEEETARMNAMGFPVVFGNRRCGYFDTRRVGNVIIELIRR